MMIEQTSKPLLRFRFEGSAIRDGRMLYDDLSTFVSNISLTIERIVNKIQTGGSIKKGRPLKAVQVLSALEIVSVRRGSFQLALDLRRNGQQFPEWDIGEQAIHKLMIGLQAIRQDRQLPPEYDYGVLLSLRDAGRIMNRGIDLIRINSHSSFGKRKVDYSQPIRERIEARIRRHEYAFTSIEGRLLMLDMEEGKLHCRIRPSIGGPISCRYDEDLAEQIVNYLRQFVQARGEATFDADTGDILSFDIRDIEPIEEATAISSLPSPLSSFWKGKSFEELAIEQAVYPMDDIGRLSIDWPEDADFDVFFEAVRSARD